MFKEAREVEQYVSRMFCTSKVKGRINYLEEAGRQNTEQGREEDKGKKKKMRLQDVMVVVHVYIPWQNL